MYVKEIGKEFDFGKSVYKRKESYPELIAIFRALGFTEAVKAGMGNAIGRISSIPISERGKISVHMQVLSVSKIIAYWTFKQRNGKILE